MNGLNQNCLFSDIIWKQLIGKKLSKFTKQGNVLPVFNVTNQTVLVQAIYVKLVSRGSLHFSCTLSKNSNMTLLVVQTVCPYMQCSSHQHSIQSWRHWIPKFSFKKDVTSSCNLPRPSTVDYRHTMTISLILCGPKSNPCAKEIFGRWIQGL